MVSKLAMERLDHSHETCLPPPPDRDVERARWRRGIRIRCTSRLKPKRSCRGDRDGLRCLRHPHQEENSDRMYSSANKGKKKKNKKKPRMVAIGFDFPAWKKIPDQSASPSWRPGLRIAAQGIVQSTRSYPDQEQSGTGGHERERSMSVTGLEVFRYYRRKTNTGSTI